MDERPARQPLLVLRGLSVLFTAGLLVYSQTLAFAWDEGFHLLTAWLINTGRKPYIDFCFPQTPLNAYWNAAWMRVFGESWRTTHAVAAVMSAVAVLLTAEFVLARFPEPRWRLPGGIAVMFLAGANAMIVQFGTIGQAYGLCLFLIVAAFRCSVASADRNGLLPPSLAGFFAGAAAASSLLTAPVAPVLLLWMLVYNRAGNRVRKCAAFVIGALIPFLPVLWLFANGPRQTLFNIFEYHFFYRQVDWAGALAHDFDVMISWIDFSQALILGLLALAGLLFVVRSKWDRARRAEFYLCAWLALALCAHISNAHPAFARYYLLMAPFLGILAIAGLYWAGSRLDAPDRPFRSVLILSILVSLGLAKTWYASRGDFGWADFEAIARKVDQVTPRGAPVLADEQVYFLTRRLPPSGMELEDSHKLNLPPEKAALLHIVSRPELDRRVRAGEFSTVQTCGDDPKMQALGLPKLYAKKAEIEDCAVYWDRVSAHSAR